MAENTSTISKEDRNFWILNILIQHVAPKAVRKVFDEKIPPNDLANILNSNVKIIQDLVNKKVINVQTQDILVRISGFKLPSMPSSPIKKATSSKYFDITLMICILRVLKFVPSPITGWDKLPQENDNSIGANLTRIKVYRNMLCHTSKAKINDKAFQKIWSTLTHAFSELSCGETDRMVREIEYFDFDGYGMEKLLCKLQRELFDIRSDMQFHHNWKVNTTNIMEEWKAELETFYETEGTKKVTKELNIKSAVLITGNSGIGKTATMKYVSFLFEKKRYEVVPISSPNDILLHRFPERNQIFILDDIVGKYRVNSAAVELWRRLYDRLRVVFKDKNVKLLSTLRRQVHAEIRSSLLPSIFNSTVVDLDSKKISLSLNEKQGMLKNYLKARRIKKNLDDEEILKISSCRIAFPLLCNLFTTNQEFLKMKSKFFHCPFIVFKEELNRLQMENKEVYCVLVLVVILHLDELQTIFDINCEKESTVAYNTILRACEVPENISRKTLHRHLQSVAGTYFETTNIFKFQHDKLEETIACHFGSQFPDIMLQYCKLDFIRDRVRLAHRPADDENILVLQQTSFDVFSRRVFDEIIKGRFRDILLSEKKRIYGFSLRYLFFDPRKLVLV